MGRPQSALAQRIEGLLKGGLNQKQIFESIHKEMPGKDNIKKRQKIYSVAQNFKKKYGKPFKKMAKKMVEVAKEVSQQYPDQNIPNQKVDSLLQDWVWSKMSPHQKNLALNRAFEQKII